MELNLVHLWIDNCILNTSRHHIEQLVVGMDELKSIIFITTYFHPKLLQLNNFDYS